MSRQKDKKKDGKGVSRGGSGRRDVREITRSRKDSARENVKKGLKAMKLRGFRFAVEWFKGAIHDDPMCEEAYSHLAYCYGIMGEPEKVVEVLEKKKEVVGYLTPGDMVNMGNAFMMLKKYRRSEECFREAIRMDPRMGAAYLSLGDMFMRLKDFKRAEIYYRMGLLHSPHDAPAWNNLGIVFMEKGEYIKAERCFLRAVFYKDNFFEALYNVGKVKMHMGEYKNAIFYLKRALKARERDESALYYLTRVCFLAEEYEDGKIYLDLLSEVNPAFADAIREEFFYMF